MSTHEHTKDEERRIREAALDETLAESFPASDAPSTLPNPDDDSLIEDPPSPPDATERGAAPAQPAPSAHR